MVQGLDVERLSPMVMEYSHRGCHPWCMDYAKTG